MYSSRYDRDIELKKKQKEFIDAVKAGDASMVDSFCTDRDIHLNWSRMSKTTDSAVSLAMCEYTHAIVMAAGLGHNDVIQVLHKHNKLNINIKNSIGETALIAASENGHLETVQLLLTHPGIDINICRNNGDNALTLAIRKHHTRIVECLLSRKDIDKSVKDCFGRTPAEMVVFYGARLNDASMQSLGLPTTKSSHTPKLFKDADAKAPSSSSPQPSGAPQVPGGIMY